MLLIFFSCKKEEKTTTDEKPVLTTSYVLKYVVDSISPTSNDTAWFYYNNIGKLVKKKYSNNKFDTVIYNASGMVVLVKTFSNSNLITPTRTIDYVYLANQLTSVTEKGANNSYTKVTTLAYGPTNLLLSLTTTGDPNNENIKLSNISWNNGNIDTATLDFNGMGLIVLNVKASCDNKLNIKKNDIIPAGGDVILLFCNNNMISVETTKPFTFLTTNIAVGTKVIDWTYKYDSKNNVVQKVERPSTISGSTLVLKHDYYYDVITK